MFRRCNFPLKLKQSGEFMALEDIEYYFAWPDTVAVQVTIEWTLPSTHDVLFSGLMPEDDTAYFYAIISLERKNWCTHYIGKVYEQSSSQRHRAADHLARLRELQKTYPGRLFHLTLGTPRFFDDFGKPDESTVDQIEGLLIYSNWSEVMINKRKIDSFQCSRQIAVENIGFIQHICRHSAYGIFYNNNQ